MNYNTEDKTIEDSILGKLKELQKLLDKLKITLIILTVIVAVLPSGYIIYTYKVVSEVKNDSAKYTHSIVSKIDNHTRGLVK